MAPSSDAATDLRAAHFRDELHRTVVEALDLSRIDRWSPERVRTEVHTLAAKMAPRIDRSLPKPVVDRAANEVIDEVFGLGPIESLLKSPGVTEVLVNAPDQVYVERNGRLERVNVSFTDAAHVTRVIQRIAARVGRRIDESSPMVDARLPDGSRVNAVLPPLTPDSPVLSIRRFGAVLSAADLVNGGTVPPQVLKFLQACVASKVNIVVSGGTGAGKTTLLNILSAYIPPYERLVTIEDTAELKLQQPHVVRMESRPANLEGKGTVTTRELLRNSLRMRPDRIIVGECRGPEVIDMLQAMNTGHEGSLTTVHANDSYDALSRLEMMLGLAGFKVPMPVMRAYIASAVQLIVHISRLTGGERKITRVTEVRGLRKRNSYMTRDIFKFEQRGVKDGRAFGSFQVVGHLPKLLNQLEMAGHAMPEKLFQAGEFQSNENVLMEDR
ncbi:CpaF family protein [Limnoglobus roseus]|uniref:CpaF family protein n=1 Tax=Limnoglobus roseus TaxID=2598579 RepID=A0A5C1A7W0_9BACT|nr:CpaF family protein [Limnoglobus roseus]QEL13258.1 CpaF family protein [Limnoglobus roseus]